MPKEDNFYQILRDNLDASMRTFVRKEYEAKKNALIQEMDQAFEREIAGIVLMLSENMQIHTHMNEIVITIMKANK